MKFIYTAAALFILIGSSASAITLHTSVSDKTKPGSSQTDGPDPGTQYQPPCNPNTTPDGCGIYKFNAR